MRPKSSSPIRQPSPDRRTSPTRKELNLSPVRAGVSWEEIASPEDRQHSILLGMEYDGGELDQPQYLPYYYDGSLNEMAADGVAFGDESSGRNILIDGISDEEETFDRVRKV